MIARFSIKIIIVLIFVLNFLLPAPGRGEIDQNTVQKVLASDGEAGDHFGISVRVDGEIAIIGSSNDNDNGEGSGSAYIFAREGTVWREKQKLIAPDGVAWDRFGAAVDIDGDTVVIGAPDYGPLDLQINGPGAAYVFVRSNIGGAPTEWTFQQKLTAEDGGGWHEFGAAVSIDGDTVIIGDHRASNENGGHAGAAYVFVRSETDSVAKWTLQQRLLSPDGKKLDMFGKSVSLKGDTVIIGALSDEMVGTAYAFIRSNAGQWILQQELSIPVDEHPEAGRYGTSVSFSGNIAVIGQPYSPSSVHIFAYCPVCKIWTRRAVLYPPEFAPGFGQRVSISGDTLIVSPGSSHDDIGAAFLYKGWSVGVNAGMMQEAAAKGIKTLNEHNHPELKKQAAAVTLPSAWTFQKAFYAPDQETGDRFGHGVSTDGTSLIIGSLGDNAETGAAYIYGSRNDSPGRLYALGNTEGGNAPMNLYTLDKDDSSATLVAETNTVGLRGLTIDPTTGRFYSAYGSTKSTEKRGIVEIDPFTGLVTDIGGTKALIALAFDEKGQLYGAENSGDGMGKIYKINIADGAETLLAEVIQQNNERGPGLAYDTNSSTLYFKGWEGQLSAIDTTTGSETLIGQVTFPWYASHSFDFDENGNVFYHQHPCSICGDGLAFGNAGELLNPINIGFSSLKVWGLANQQASKCGGDVNGDGKIDQADMYELKLILLGSCDQSDIPECADCDNSGYLTLTDIICIKKAILNNCEPGDANVDGFITRSDICKAHSMMLKWEYSTCADCNEDGILSLTDLDCINRKTNYDECTAGDANLDGQINFLDAYEIENLIASCRTDEIPTCADCNQDGSFDNQDWQCINGLITKNCKPGDANEDGFITYSDICKVKQQLDNSEYSTCADCDKDGNLDIFDLVCIVGKLTGASDDKVNIVPLITPLLLK